MTLNSQQQAAVEASGPVLVIAGPGTGKTKTLTERIAYLMQSGKVPPSEILALTFTKKAADEMCSRVEKLIDTNQGWQSAGQHPPRAHGGARGRGRRADRTPFPKITTFHGLCYELLGRELKFVGEAQRLQLIKSVPKPASLREYSARELGLLVSKAKNAVDPPEPDIAKITKAYNLALRGQNLYDFDDLLVETHALLANDEAARAVVRQRFSHIFVDEFQDTNRLQYEILKLLGARDNLFVIGDPNQSIYGFRGAGGDIFGQFTADFPAVRQITLTANYRSAAEIVRLGNAIFPEQPALEPQSKLSGQVRAIEVLNEYSEAEWVLGEMQKAIGGADFLQAVSDDERHSQRSLRDFAILYRSRSAATTLQKLIAESALPYQVVGDGSPYEKPEVQAVITLLRASESGENPQLEGFSASQTRALFELLRPAGQIPPSTLAERIIKTLGLELNRDLLQLVGTLVRFETAPAALRYFDDIAEHGFYDAKAEAVTLLTIHAAKGLEFPVVFLVGAEEDLLPNKRADKNEERRLFYVAVTRAKERLDVLHARRRGGQPARASSFIADIPATVLSRLVDPNLQTQARRLAKRQAKRSQQSLF